MSNHILKTIMNNEVITFMMLYEILNFTKVSEKLNIHQSTVTRRIQQLEKSLDTKLVIRSLSGIEITEVGHQFYQDLIKQESLFKNIVTNKDNSKKRVAIRLKVALPVVASYYLITPYLATFIRENPHISLDIYYYHHTINMAKDDFDLAIVNYREESQQTILIRKLFTTKFGLFCTSKYKEKYGIPEDYDDLQKNHLLVGSLNHKIKPSTSSYMAVDDSKTPINSNNIMHNVKIAESNEAIIICSEVILKDRLLDGTFIQIMKDSAVSEISYYLIRKNSRKTSSTQEFIDFIDKYISIAKSNYPGLTY